jgi:hypothetical protein
MEVAYSLAMRLSEDDREAALSVVVEEYRTLAANQGRKPIRVWSSYSFTVRADQMTTATAFALGFEIGSRYGEQTAREAVQRFPLMVEVEAYCNGSIDGARGDRFRLEYVVESRGIRSTDF